MSKDLTKLEQKLIEILKNSKFKPKADVVYLKLIPTMHRLTKEEQIYFHNLTEPIFGYNEEVRNGKLEQLATDYHVTIILPDLCTFIKHTIRHNLAFKELTLLIYGMRMVKSLLANQHVKLKPCIHQILPAVLSCGLSKSISMYYIDNHWTLREFAGVIVASICATYSDECNNMKQRVINLYTKGLVDADKHLTTAFGAIKGLQSMGEEEVKNHLIPNIMIISKKIQKSMETNYQNLGFMEQKNEINIAKHVRTVMVSVCAPILFKTRNINDGGVTYAKEFGYLGKPLYIQVKNIECLQLVKQMRQFGNVLDVSEPNSPVNQGTRFSSPKENPSSTLTQANANQAIILNRANGNQSVQNQNPTHLNAVNVTPGIRPLNSSSMRSGPVPNNSWFKSRF